MKSIKLIFAGMFCLSMVLNGCGSKTEEKTVEPAAEKVEEKQGEAFTFTNNTNKTITSLSIRESSGEKFGGTLLEKEVKSGDKAVIYPEAKADTKYDIQFTADDTTYTIEDLPFDQMESAELLIENKEAYVNYTNQDGKTISTKKEAPVEEIVVTEEAPAEEPTYEQTYTESYYDEPVYNDGGTAVPSDDGCLSGISESDLN